MNKIKITSLVLLTTSFLVACSTKSNVRADGTTDKPVFPEPYSVTFNNSRGTFPTVDELVNIKAGMTKDQLYKLIGRPHYDEGMFNVREWDYLFHFHTPGQGTNDVTTCQFKVIYDKDKYARSFFWRAVDPVDAVCPPKVPAKGPTHILNLGADALFAFDKSGRNDILPEGYVKLDRLAEDIKRFEKVSAIRIVGHTDYKGSEAYNDALSKQRAETVRQYLVSRGVPAGVMSVQGMGERFPVQDCSVDLSPKEEVKCLQPNRRVSIEVDGVGQLKKE